MLVVVGEVVVGQVGLAVLAVVEMVEEIHEATRVLRAQAVVEAGVETA